jgi:streptogramin lyase
MSRSQGPAHSSNLDEDRRAHGRRASGTSTLTPSVRTRALVLIGLGLLTGCGGSSTGGATRGGVAGDAAPDVSGGCPARARLLAAMRLHIGRGAGPLAVQDGKVWVARPQADKVTEVTPVRRRVLNTGSAPTSLAVGFGKLWIAERDANRVTSFDTRTLSRVTVSDVSVPVSVVTSAFGVWALSLDAGTVNQIDPTSGGVYEPIDAPVVSPSGMVMVGDDLWILGAADHGLSPLNVKLRRIVRAGFDLPGRPLNGLSAGRTAIWLGDTAKRAVLRVDSRTVAVRQLPAPEGMQPIATAVGSCGVWVADAIGDLALIDPRSGAPVAPLLHIGHAVAAMAAAGTSLWVTDPAAGTLVNVAIRPAG